MSAELLMMAVKFNSYANTVEHIQKLTGDALEGDAKKVATEAGLMALSLAIPDEVQLVWDALKPKPQAAPKPPPIGNYKERQVRKG